ncbi:MAG: thiamine phosphate synthase [Fervidobacterium pennivorans]
MMSYIYSNEKANEKSLQTYVSDVEKKLGKLKLFLDYNIYGMTSEKFSKGRSNISVVKHMLDCGIKIIQYREKQKSMREKYKEAIEIRKITKEYGALLIINDHIDLCKIVEADGVHLGQDDIPVFEARRILGEKYIIGVTVHTKEQFLKAFDEGADYVGLGPIYQSFTKERPHPPIGTEIITWAKKYNKPFVTIGGIKEHNVREVLQKGAKCVCSVTEILEAEDIISKIKNLWNILEEFKRGEMK